MIDIAIKFDTTRMQRALEAIKAGMSNGSEILRAHKQMGARYIADMKARFMRGGDGWPKLEDSTLKARRQGGASRGGTSMGSPAILVDTGVLRNTLDIFRGAPGQKQELIPGGIRVGIQGGAHESKVSRRETMKAKATLGKAVERMESAITAKGGRGFKSAKHALEKALKRTRKMARSSTMDVGYLAAIHHFGLGHAKVRTILVQPSEKCKAGMESDLNRALEAIILKAAEKGLYG